MKKQNIFYIVSLIAIITVFIWGVNLTVAEWAAPTANPPGENALAPIHVGGAQVKDGGLVVGFKGTTTKGLIVLNGDVGIGTASPEAKLNVIGPSILEAPYTSEVLRIGAIGRDAIGKLMVDYSGASGGISLASGPGKIFINSATGNVGIETTNPQGKLQVGADTGDNTNTIFLSGDVRITSFGSDIAYLQARETGSTNVGLQLRTQNAGSVVDVMRLTNTGNVGIGTTGLSSNSKLAVNNGNIEVYNPNNSYNRNSSGMILGTYRGDGFIQIPVGAASSIKIWNNDTGTIASFNNNGNLDVIGDVKGTRLCIGSDCRNNWPADGGGGSTYMIVNGSQINSGMGTVNNYWDDNYYRFVGWYGYRVPTAVDYADRAGSLGTITEEGLVPVKTMTGTNPNQQVLLPFPYNQYTGSVSYPDGESCSTGNLRVCYSVTITGKYCFITSVGGQHSSNASCKIIKVSDNSWRLRTNDNLNTDNPCGMRCIQ